MESAKQGLAVGFIEQERSGCGNHDAANEPAALAGIGDGGKAALQNLNAGVAAGTRSPVAETELDQNGALCGRVRDGLRSGAGGRVTGERSADGVEIGASPSGLFPAAQAGERSGLVFQFLGKGVEVGAGLFAMLRAGFPEPFDGFFVAALIAENQRAGSVGAGEGMAGGEFAMMTGNGPSASD